MTDIIELAKNAGAGRIDEIFHGPDQYCLYGNAVIKLFAKMIAEECAGICDNTGPDDWTGENCAAAIRAKFCGNGK
jgi:hypothetical protein